MLQSKEIIMSDDIGIRIKELRGGKTQAEFAAEVGVEPSYISLMESGKRTPSKTVTELIAVKCGVSIEWLTTGAGPKFKGPGAAEELKKYSFDVVDVPVYALAGAGNPKELFESEPIGKIAISVRKYKPGMTALRVSGESMEPTIKDGAEVLVDRQAVDLVDGRIYVVYLKDNGIVLKRLYRGPGVILLKSDNPSSPELMVKPEEMVIQGRVTGVYQEL